MRSSTCSAYKHGTFIPYALANVVEDEGDFTVAEGHGHPLVFVNDPLDGHAHLKSKCLALMNIIELAYSLSKLKHHLLTHKK